MEDPGVDWRVILKWGLKYGDWIDLAQDTDRWWAVVNTVFNLRVLLKSRNFETI
jgi:hypothetical protein